MTDAEVFLREAQFLERRRRVLRSMGALGAVAVAGIALPLLAKLWAPQAFDAAVMLFVAGVAVAFVGRDPRLAQGVAHDDVEEKPAYVAFPTQDERKRALMMVLVAGTEEAVLDGNSILSGQWRLADARCAVTRSPGD